MSKLDIENVLFDAMQEEPTEKRGKGRPRKEGLIRTEDGGPSIQAGLPPELRRFTVICKVKTWKFLKDYAFTKRITLRDALDDIVEDFAARYEKNPKNEPILDREEAARARRNKK